MDDSVCGFYQSNNTWAQSPYRLQEQGRTEFRTLKPVLLLDLHNIVYDNAGNMVIFFVKARRKKLDISKNLQVGWFSFKISHRQSENTLWASFLIILNSAYFVFTAWFDEQEKHKSPPQQLII